MGRHGFGVLKPGGGNPDFNLTVHVDIHYQNTFTDPITDCQHSGTFSLSPTTPNRWKWEELQQPDVCGQWKGWVTAAIGCGGVSADLSSFVLGPDVPIVYPVPESFFGSSVVLPWGQGTPENGGTITVEIPA